MAKITYGLIGHPVKHSLSPAMQNAAFAALSIDASYKLFDVAPSDLEEFLKCIAKDGIAGVNVTIPHKVKAMEFIKSHGILNEHAARLGAVNTIKVSGGKLVGFNTDGPGFYRSLVEDLKFEPEGKSIFVLGAGGAARAIVMYLGDGPKEMSVYDVDSAATKDLEKNFKKHYNRCKFKVVGKDELRESIGLADLLVQATPVGMHDGDPLPVDAGFLHPGLCVYDLVYNRPSTKLVESAAKMRLRAVTGLGMLLHQGAIAFNLWTEKKAPIEVMKKALKEALKSHG